MERRNNVVGDFSALGEMVEKTNFHAKNYVWKGKKIRKGDGTFEQEEILLMDTAPQQLKAFFNHCLSMLYNKDHQSPGRYPLLQIIQNQKDRCGAELFLRESERNGTSRYSIAENIKQTIRYSGITQDQLRTMVLKDFVIVDSRYEDIPITLIEDACINRLGKFDKSHITLTFILKQGLRITEEDDRELTEFESNEKGDSVRRPILDVVRERLNIADHMKLRVDPKGLTYKELRAMLSLRNLYYNELQTEQLTTLRYKILFLLEDDVRFHIQQWETHIKQIKEVAQLRDIDLEVKV